MDDDEFLSTDHEISLDRSVEIINSEIQWAYRHKVEFSLRYRFISPLDFIKGLEQAKYLLIEMAKHEALDDLYTRQAASQQASDDDIRRQEEAQNGR